jgi:hypothetical protein
MADDDFWDPNGDMEEKDFWAADSPSKDSTGSKECAHPGKQLDDDIEDLRTRPESPSDSRLASPGPGPEAQAKENNHSDDDKGDDIIESESRTVWSAFGSAEKVLGFELDTCKSFSRGIKHRSWKYIGRPKRYVLVKRRAKKGKAQPEPFKSVLMKGFRINEHSNKPEWKAQIFTPFEGCRLVDGCDIPDVLPEYAKPSDWAAALAAEKSFKLTFKILPKATKRSSKRAASKKHHVTRKSQENDGSTGGTGPYSDGDGNEDHGTDQDAQNSDGELKSVSAEKTKRAEQVRLAAAKRALKKDERAEQVRLATAQKEKEQAEQKRQEKERADERLRLDEQQRLARQHAQRDAYRESVEPSGRPPKHSRLDDAQESGHDSPYRGLPAVPDSPGKVDSSFMASPPKQHLRGAFRYVRDHRNDLQQKCNILEARNKQLEAQLAHQSRALRMSNRFLAQQRLHHFQDLANQRITAAQDAALDQALQYI